MLNLVVFENTKGNGWVTLQVSGELSAVTVAVQAVKDYLPDVYVTSVIIGRPAIGLELLGQNRFIATKSRKAAKYC